MKLKLYRSINRDHFFPNVYRSRNLCRLISIDIIWWIQWIYVVVCVCSKVLNIFCWVFPNSCLCLCQRYDYSQAVKKELYQTSAGDQSHSTGQIMRLLRPAMCWNQTSSIYLVWCWLTSSVTLCNMRHMTWQLMTCRYWPDVAWWPPMHLLVNDHNGLRVAVMCSPIHINHLYNWVIIVCWWWQLSHFNSLSLHVHVMKLDMVQFM